MKGGVKYSKYFVKRTIKLVVISLITCLATIGVYFATKRPDGLEKMVSFLGGSRIKRKLDLSNPPTTKLISNVRTAFNSYFKTCKKFDEILPRQKTCKKTVGFHASLLESIETLYLLNLKEEYQKALNFITNDFNCSKLQWVNRHEFWSRGIGSLIGSYTLTGNKIFLRHAEECADLMLSVDEIDTQEAYSFVNLQQQEGKKRSWQNGNAISDITAGLPELAALYHITKKTKYEDAIESIYGKIPIQDSRVGQFYDKEGKKLSSVDYNDGYTTSFFFNTVLGVILKENIETLTFVSEAISNIPTDIKNYPNLNYPLLDVAHYFEVGEIPSVISIEDDLYDLVKTNYSRPIYSAFSLDSNLYKLGFNFEGAAIRALARDVEDNVKGKETIIKTVNEAFVRTKLGSGFSGMRKTSSIQQTTSLNHVMSSNIFGQWASVGALAASGNLRLINTSVINERGHFLLLKFPENK